MADLEKMILAKRENGFNAFLGNLEKSIAIKLNQKKTPMGGLILKHRKSAKENSQHHQ